MSYVSITFFSCYRFYRRVSNWTREANKRLGIFWFSPYYNTQTTQRTIFSPISIIFETKRSLLLEDFPMYLSSSRIQQCSWLFQSSKVKSGLDKFQLAPLQLCKSATPSFVGELPCHWQNPPIPEDDCNPLALFFCFASKRAAQLLWCMAKVQGAEAKICQTMLTPFSRPLVNLH